MYLFRNKGKDPWWRREGALNWHCWMYGHKARPGSWGWFAPKQCERCDEVM